MVAAFQSEEEVAPPSFDDQRVEFDAALNAEVAPAVPLNERDRSNRLFLDVIGAA